MDYLYEQDYYLWSQKMATLLRAKNWDDLDIENIAEEIESLGRADRNALKSNLRIILMHLLKWQYQPEKQTRSWQLTLLEHRQRVKDTLADSPSLRGFLEENLEICYSAATKMAAVETGLAVSHFPKECPYTAEQILDEGYFPNGE
jgi:hypothetical protein